MTNKKNSNGGGSFILGALVGAIAGGIAGILNAPKSGKETQADLKKGAEKVAKKAESEYKKAVNSVCPAKKTTKKPAAKKTTK